jgi:L-alanine-DL-glutamate epimerase-like enolase superfamily enzyme
VKITRIETIPVNVPIDAGRAIKGGGGAHTESPFLVVKVHTDAGLIGLGEVSCTPGWSGEDQVTAAHFIDTILAPLLTGQDPRDVEQLSGVAGRALFGHPFTKAALEMAMWDILGKAAGLPVYRLLGGKVREFVPTKWSVSGVEPARAAEIASWAVEQGFRTMKVKVGIDPEQDVARVSAVREAVGDGVRLGVDANGAWDARTAVGMVNRLRDFDIYFVEQPVPRGDLNWMLEVRLRAGIPVIADESIYTAQDPLSIMRANAADALSIYVGKAAGIGPARKIAAIAEAAMFGCTVGSNLEMGIGSAAMIHVGLATPGITADEFPCDIIGPLFYTDDLLKEPLPITGGEARAHERPGLGVELDEAKVQRYRV